MHKFKFYQIYLIEFALCDGLTDICDNKIFRHDKLGRNVYPYAIAIAKKAICDKLYTLKPVKNKREMYELLFNDLRIDIDGLKRMDMESLNQLCDIYKSANVKIFKKVIVI